MSEQDVRNGSVECNKDHNNIYQTRVRPTQPKYYFNIYFSMVVGFAVTGFVLSMFISSGGVLIALLAVLRAIFTNSEDSNDSKNQHTQEPIRWGQTLCED